MKFKIEKLFRPKSQNPEREELIKQQNNIEGLTVLVSYKVVKEDGEPSYLSLYDNLGVPPNEILYHDAMEKLARDIVEKK